jgi:hypothetical protein
VGGDQKQLPPPRYCTNIFNFVHSVILIPKMPNGESRGNELGDDQQERETIMGDLSGGEQLGSRDTVRSRTSLPATLTTCVPHLLLLEMKRENNNTQDQNKSVIYISQ